MSAEVAQAAPDPGPELLMRGTFSLYRTPEGGLHIAFRPVNGEEDQHLPIPPALVKMAMAAQSGKGPFGHMAKMFGRA